MTITLDAIRACFEGVIPGILATASPDGTPNVSFLSQVQFVDSQHVALTYQFFNRTRQNILLNHRAALIVTHPWTSMQYRLQLEYLHTETSGPLFERMKAKLAGIASHAGMSGVFRLRGSDVYHVREIQPIPGQALPEQPPKRNLLSALRNCSERLAACNDLERLLTETLSCLDQQFAIHYTMVLLLDKVGERLYTVGSHGYVESGIGSEIPLGQGVIGVAARERASIRIGHANSEYAYGRAIRESTEDSHWVGALEMEIPLPGLADARSQLAVPIMNGNSLLGVLYVESPQDVRFTYDDEDALVALAHQLGMSIQLLQGTSELDDDAMAATSTLSPPAGTKLTVRHYAENDSIFLDNDYLIKGVAGSILWALLRDYADHKRTEFTNRELRLDARIRLPDVSDNLEARLILLSKRLLERQAGIHIEKTARGRFRLCVGRPIVLLES